jgi:hypothetical protein
MVERAKCPLLLKLNEQYLILVFTPTRLGESQIVAILKEAELNAKVGETCRKHCVSELTYYKWIRAVNLRAKTGRVSCGTTTWSAV